ncbi:MAG: hypothetical protein OXQ93_07950 [Gemmatimonadota bacterium]|nr:hypothetical protein [Gemmatimonadota bacterium]
MPSIILLVARKQWNENHPATSPADARRSVLEAIPTYTATTTSSNPDLKVIANGEVLQMDDHRLSGEPPAPVTSFRCDSTVRGWHDPPATTSTAIAVLAACARLACHRPSLANSAASTASASSTTCRPIGHPAVRDLGLAAAAAATAATSTVEIQAFEAEATSTAAAPTCGAANH